ncbi:MAG: PQQ-dependent sugar dehydrogenase [Verrucomicrobiaceae bacterium]|nr:PQQ-dependent sugar dehydrogenase [Verrucomicrobiaceae bacterium]
MKSSPTTVCAFLFSCRRVFAMVMLAFVFMPALAHAQSYGIATKPTVGPYFDNAFPATPPTVGTFTAVDAYPNLTFINPTGILQVPGQSKMMVWQREGAVYLFDKASTTATKTLVLDISDRCQGWDDSGMMNLVFHPQFDLSGAPGTNRYIYVFYEWVPPGTVVGSPTTRPNNIIPAMRDRIARFELDANGIEVPGSEVVIMDQAASNTWHNGSGMFFHPVNGFLYWTNGEDADGPNAQMINSKLLGGVFRVDVDKRGGNVSHPPVRVPVGVTTQNYYIPNNNPFVGMAGVNEEFFALGMRSPHRMTHDAVTGRTFISDVGGGDREEVDIIEPTESGLNFQWDKIEGLKGDLTPPYIGVNKRPVIDYPRSDGSAIIGGYVYRGTAFPELQGKYLFADNITNRVWALNEGTNPATKTLLTTVPNGPGPNSGSSYVGISSWGVDSDGEVYLCRLSSTEGKILKLERGSAPSTPLPATLSATGLLTDVTGFVPSDKLIPYTINAPFWSDKAIKSRWLTVPTGSTIGFNATGDWSFPAGSIAMKHFDLATDETNPAVRKRLETRVLVKMANGGSYGATYRWRADNSDADLINEGVTEIVPVTIPSVGTFTPTDIGSPGVAGSTTVNGNTLTLTGGGSDIWGNSDQFHFAHQQRTGDFDITMKATSFTPAVLYSKFGLMARASLEANSPHYFIFAWASNAGRGANSSGYEDHYRTTAGGNTTATYPAAGTHLVSYPNGWLRLARKGNTFISYTSADGANWAEYGRQTIAMPSTLYFGIAMNAHDNGLAATGTIELQTTRLQPWYFPGRTDCTTCHTNNAGGGFIGPNTRQFNKDHFYTASGVTDNQLRAFNHVGMFNTALDEPTIPSYEKLAHVDQTSESLEKRARSYVDTNCANCHRPGGVHALWDARYDTPLANQGIIYGSVGSTLGLVNPRVVVPQSIDRSMMHHRTSRVGANQMPPLGRNLVDEAGVKLLADWINSIPANDPPVVALTSPVNGANVITPNPVALEATATDADGIVRVEFFDGATKVGEDTTAPYTFSYSDIAQGTHTLFARAYDGVNNSADSASVTINVTELPGLVRAKINYQTAAAAVPSGYVADSGLSYAARGNGMTYGWSRDNTADSRERNANADKRYDTLVHMQKDHGGGDVTSSWSIALPNSTYSVHVVTGDATSTDSVHAVTANGVALTTGLPAGQNFYEATATVTVTNGLLTIAPAAGAVNAKLCYVDISELAPDNGNQLPVIALTGVSPEFPTVGANANLSAAASDSDGTITKVEFYANGLKIGEDTTAPYVFSWTGYTAGTYHITARAVDDDGDGATTSSAVVVSVFSPGQTGLYAQYFNAADFTSLFLSRVEATLNADWGNAAPVTGMMADNFSTRWRGRLLTRDAGNYTLKFFADDGIRVWVNGSLVIDRWAYDPAAVTATLTLTGNSLHDLRVDHREDGGGARVQMLWSGPGFAEETVPSTNLVTPATSVPSEQLAGTVIGTNGSWNNDPNTTKAAVFDGNLNTYYDALEGNGAWAGLDLGAGNSRIITEVRYAPRQFHEWRMLGGLLQGANNADFSDAVTLHTVAEQPPTAGVLTSHLITNNTAFRYVRYLSPNNGFCNVAEVVFLGTTASSPVPLNLAAVAGNAQVALTWLPSAGATGYNVKRATVSGGPYATIASNVLTNTFTDTGLMNGITYHYVVSALSSGGESVDSSPASATPFTPVPAGFTATAGNAQVVLSWNSVSGSTGYELKRGSSPAGPFTTYAANLPGTGYTDTSAANFTLYYYVISALHPSGNSADSAAVSAVPLPPKLTGTIIGTTGSWNNDPNSTRAAVFDGNLNTFFDALEANGAWAGLDLGAGATKRIAAIRYAPRAAWASGRMTGGRFQGANNADFSDAVTLHTIVGAPAADVLTTQLVSNPNGFRYVRYLSPDNGFCNVAEVEFYGSDALPAAPTGLAATAGHTQVGLTWNSVAGATSYNVKRGTANGGPYSTVATGIVATNHIDTGLTNDTTYYVVTAVNAGGESANSNQASATPVSPPITETETQAPAMTMTASEISLSVAASVVGHTYQLQKSETLGAWENVGSPVPGTGGPLGFTAPVPPPSTTRCFYRILIQR